jgi:hypothetical protein
MNRELETVPTLFSLNGVPVKVRKGFWLMPPLLWLGLAWIAGRRRVAWSLPRRLVVSGLAVPLAASGDLGHVAGHTVSARLAGAPMDVILLGADMPRTLYWEQNVTPRKHILRAAGGPLANLLGVMVGMLWRRAAAPGTISRELAETTVASHGALVLGSLLPLPIVDGGVFLKWGLVLRGHPAPQAGQIVNRVSVTLGTGALAAGAVLLLVGRRVAGALLAAGGALAAAAGLEWLK